MNFNFQLGKLNLSFGSEARGVTPAQFLRGDDGASGGATLVSAYQQSTWVYACVTLLSESVSTIPFRLLTGEEDKAQSITGGPLLELFAAPHPQIDRFAFWELITSWLMLRGEAFVVPLDGAGRTLGSGARIRPERLLILPPDSFREIVANNELKAWQFTGSGTTGPLETMALLPEEVVHLKLPNPYDFWRGMSPLSVAQLAASSDYASAQFEKGLMLNNADTGVIVTTEQQLNDEQRLSIQKALEERKRKAGTADRPLFLFGGAKVDKPQISSADMQFLENRKFKRQEICAIFRVPQELLGFTEDANRSVGDAARLNFIENRVAPLCCRIEACMNPLIARIDKRAHGEFHVKGTPVMQAAQRTRWDTALKAFAVGVPLNTANELFDLGLPELPHGDKAYLPFSLQPVGDDGLPETTEPAATTPPADEAAKALTAALEICSRSPATPRVIKTVHQCGANTAYAAAIAGSVKRKRTTLRNFFTAQQGRVLAKLEQETEAKATRTIDDILDLALENEKLLAKMTPLLKGDLLFGGSQVWQELGLNPDDFAVPPAKALEFLAKRSNEIKGVNKTTFEKLKGSLADGLSEGDTHAELVDRVKEIYQGATDARAETIATTETNIAVNSGRFEAMQEAGVERKGWQASNLEGVRPEHLQAELDYADEGVPIDEPFIVMGEELMHPGDPGGSPGNTINCRCFTFAILPEKGMGSTESRPTKHLLSYEDWSARSSKEARP